MPQQDASNGPVWTAVPFETDSEVPPVEVDKLPKPRAPDDIKTTSDPESYVDSEGPVWTTEPYNPEGDQTPIDGEKLSKLTAEHEVSSKVWRDIKMPPKDPHNQARQTILTTTLVLIIGLLFAYIGLGYPYVKNVDDVIKLLNSPLSMTATVLGAAVAFYFSQNKH